MTQSGRTQCRDAAKHLRWRRRIHQERIAVQGRMHDRLGADIAVGARPVLDDELLTKSLRGPLPRARLDMNQRQSRLTQNGAGPVGPARYSRMSQQPHQHCAWQPQCKARWNAGRSKVDPRRSSSNSVAAPKLILPPTRKVFCVTVGMPDWAPSRWSW